MTPAPGIKAHASDPLVFHIGDRVRPVGMHCTLVVVGHHPHGDGRVICRSAFHTYGDWWPMALVLIASRPKTQARTSGGGGGA